MERFLLKQSKKNRFNCLLLLLKKKLLISAIGLATVSVSILSLPGFIALS